jgi:hypothetical protein
MSIKEKCEKSTGNLNSSGEKFVLLPTGDVTSVNAGAGVKTNLLFFTKGKPTEKFGIMTYPASKSARKTLSRWHISNSSSACCPSGPTANAVGR